ncbi:hypothetical protein NUW58_g8377 [Xylaria curta]|uniref:Uncharacterized protein n=1 Tax=Xylaria curta TaxID=42375 RepID=A0ACC1N7V4_9PEZI|nr:hypothetical protein NUW58_g8377 [Xylaria curta]
MFLPRSPRAWRRPCLKVTDPVLIEASVRRAVIEAFALREAGREDELVTMWPTAMPKNHLLGLLAWEVKSTEDGGVALGGDPLTVAEGLRWNDKDYATTSGDGDNTLYEPLTPEEAYALSQTWGSSWKSILLADPRIRFAVYFAQLPHFRITFVSITKRVFQLTGQSVTDRELSSITTVHNLIRILKKPPKPATLTQEIQERHLDLLHLPNVAVASKRVTRGDKEKALGRFKLMQEEFRKRNMPAYGHGNVRKGKEISRLRGGT